MDRNPRQSSNKTRRRAVKARLHKRPDTDTPRVHVLDTTVFATRPLLLRPVEAGDVLGFRRATVYKLIADGVIPSIKIAGEIRIPYEGLRDWILREVDKQKPTTTETAPPPCSLTGRDHIFAFDYSPIKLATGPPPEHTIVYLFACACGAVKVFPEDNFRRLEPQARAAFVRRLIGEGRFLVTRET